MVHDADGVWRPVSLPTAGAGGGGGGGGGPAAGHPHPLSDEDLASLGLPAGAYTRSILSST